MYFLMDKIQASQAFGLDLKKGNGFAQYAELIFDIGLLDIDCIIDEHGNTALHLAAYYGNVEYMKFLIDRGANVNVKNRFGDTPLHKAVESSSAKCAAALDLLLSSNAHVEVENHEGETPLLVLAVNKSAKNVKSAVAVLAKYNANLYAEVLDTDYTVSAMSFAITEGNLNLVQALINNGYDVNCKGYLSPLHEAAANYEPRMVEFLLKNGANVDALDDEDATPLCTAVDQTKKNARLHNHNKTKKLKKIMAKSYESMRILLEHRPSPKVLAETWFYSFYMNLDGLEFVYKTLTRYEAKWKFEGRPVQMEAITDLSRLDWIARKCVNYSMECTAELQRLKSTKIGEGPKTYYNLLVDDEDKLVSYGRNRSLVKSYKQFNVVDKFSCYGALIKWRFSRALKQKAIVDRAAEVLVTCLPIPVNSNDVHLLNILKYLDPEDLLKSP